MHIMELAVRQPRSVNVEQSDQHSNDAHGRALENIEFDVEKCEDDRQGVCIVSSHWNSFCDKHKHCEPLNIIDKLIIFSGSPPQGWKCFFGSAKVLLNCQDGCNLSVV